MIEEGSAFVDFVVCGGQVNGLSVDLSLELSLFVIELFDSFLVGCLVVGFLGGELVETVDDFGSEFVEGILDLSDDFLVGEVL